MIVGTVALPVWNSKKIVWLCLESLCRQHKPVGGWELIVFEEKHGNQVGKDFILSYKNRLKEVGCERIEYISCTEKISLSQKWVKISWETSDTSKYYCFCAADNYYHPWMLQDSEKAIEKYEWFVTTKSYFYDFKYNKIIKYDCTGNYGIQMTGKTELIRKLPLVNLKRGIDGWLYKTLKPKRILIDKSDHWKYTLCTNSLNNISRDRVTFFTRTRRPFYKTDIVLGRIVSDDICEQIIGLKNELKLKK